jgi:plastocyanin
MNIRQHVFVAFALVASTVCITAQTTSGNASEPAFAVNGEAALAAPDSGTPAKDASRIVVWLSPINAIRPVRATIEHLHYRLLQHNKRFEPGLLVVPVGSVVDFPNADPWFHNVFSLYRGKRFDLGLYEAGAQRSVRFDRLGPSYLFCNIHPEMTGVVLAIDSELFAVTDKGGHYAIAGVTPGKYVLHVWYESATAESLQALERLITIQSEDQTLPAISVKATKRTPAEHKNKYGQDYDPEALKTDY